MTIVTLAAFAAIDLGGDNSSKDSWLGFGFQDGYSLSLCRVHELPALRVVLPDGKEHEITAARGFAPEGDIDMHGAESIRSLLVSFANMDTPVERFFEILLLSGMQRVCAISRKKHPTSPVYLTWHLDP